jgi:hypothetical protein
MFKKYVIIFILCTFHITLSKKIEVEYDETRDIIMNNGKMYISLEQDLTRNNNYRYLLHGESSEEEVSEAKFWFYVFLVLCKFFFYLF